MTKRGDLNFPVGIYDIYYKEKNCGEGIYFTKAVGQRAVIREDTSTVFGSVSERYFPLTHTEAVRVFEKALSETGLVVHEPQFALRGDGARLCAVYKHPEIVEEIAPGDSIHMTSILQNSFDGSLAFTYEVGAFRWACANGARVGRTFMFIKQPHVCEVDITMLTKGVGRAIETFKKACSRMTKWSKEVVDRDKASDFVKSLQLPLIMTQILENGIRNQGVLTKWSFFNLLTAACSHLTTSDRVVNKIESAYLKEMF